MLKKEDLINFSESAKSKLSVGSALSDGDISSMESSIVKVLQVAGSDLRSPMYAGVRQTELLDSPGYDYIKDDIKNILIILNRMSKGSGHGLFKEFFGIVALGEIVGRENLSSRDQKLLRKELQPVSNPGLLGMAWRRLSVAGADFRVGTPSPTSSAPSVTSSTESHSPPAVGGSSQR